MGNFKPRKYQSEGIKAGVDFFTSPAKNPSLMVFPCAAGKSHIIAEIVRYLEDSTLIVVPSQELLMQNYEKFVHAGGVATLYSASVNSKIISKVTFATIGSLKDKSKEFKAYGVKNIIVDEAHFSIPPEKDSVFSTFIRELGSPRILGLTATPFLLKGGMDGSSLKMLTRLRPKLFKDILYVSQISEMVENNWWTPLEYELHPFDASQLDLNTTGANYTEASIKLALETQGINNRIYKRIIQLQKERAHSILVFVDSVETAEIFASKIPNSAYVHGGTNKAERLAAVEDFKLGKIQVMFNYGTFTTGFDYPELSHVILGRPSNSFSLIYQMCGRVVRISPKKKKGYIIDFCGNIKNFGRLEDITVEDYPNYGWGIFSRDQLLTGCSLKGPKVFKKDLIPKKEISVGKGGEFVINIGKFKGKSLKQVKRSYLEWMIFASGFDFSKGAMKEFYEKSKQYLESTKMEYVK
jgi:DNA repair protein RadD